MSPEVRTWWAAVLNKSERQRLELLISLALVDPSVRRLLVVYRDPKLLTLFRFSEETRTWLCCLDVLTLEDFTDIIAVEPPDMPSTLLETTS